MILHCIEDNFTIFLNKSYYINISDKQCGHSYYGKTMFNHHNLLKYNDDYNYYTRCVDRFRNLLKQEQPKLFIIYLNYMDDMTDQKKNSIIEFNNKFSQYTKNYILLTVCHIKNKGKNYHNFTYNDNIHFLELHTVSLSNGVDFTNNNDNLYLDTILKTKYTFNIKS
jgi:hypothetical protein